jgi:HSP20 family protein
MYEDRHDIFSEMDRMVSRLFSSTGIMCGEDAPSVYGYRIIFRNGMTPHRVPGGAEPPEQTSSAEPVIEVHRIGNEVKVIAGLPGAAKDTIKLKMEGHKLIIDADGSARHYHGATALPADVSDSLQYSFKNGVLEVTFSVVSGTGADTGHGH